MLKILFLFVTLCLAYIFNSCFLAKKQKIFLRDSATLREILLVFQVFGSR
jgi:integral membrane sensor domain MASE1